MFGSCAYMVFDLIILLELALLFFKTGWKTGGFGSSASFVGATRDCCWYYCV